MTAATISVATCRTILRTLVSFVWRQGQWRTYTDLTGDEPVPVAPTGNGRLPGLPRVGTPAPLALLC